MVMSDDGDTSVDLIAVITAMKDGEPCVLTVDGSENAPPTLPSGPLRAHHKTLQAGVRSWAEQQTGQTLGFVEQLYTFGDRQDGSPKGCQQRKISIVYLALVSPIDSEPRDGKCWRRWYSFLPWEDHRRGQPRARACLLNDLYSWSVGEGRRNHPYCEELTRLTFGIDDAPWDEERTLERYEMLYEAGLVPEALLDRKLVSASGDVIGAGIPMYADHRRILATAISRIRSKIKYRPVLFELMPSSFTLLQLQRTMEALSGVALHKQNFRRLIMQQKLVEETGALADDTGGRPAKLMRFRREVTLERPAPGVRLKALRRGAAT